MGKGDSSAGKGFDMELALRQAPRTVGRGCRFSPFKEGASMVLEVSDRSIPNACTQYAIRASIPPAPLSAEIQKVQHGWFDAGKATSAKELYKIIPMIHPNTHLIASHPVPAIRRFPLLTCINADWLEIIDHSLAKLLRIPRRI